MSRDVDIERFNERQSAKWMHLPKAEVEDLAAELAKRDGVTVMKLEKGQRFEFHGPGELVFLPRR